MEIYSKTGKSLDDININSIMNSQITAEDIKISKDVLEYQGDIARNSDRVQLGENFDRASELVDVPDETIFEIYNKLRPKRATKQELIDLAQMLETKYKAHKCAKLILEAAEIYEKRNILI